MAILNISALDVINLITLFYYKNNHLRYQILLHLTGERTVLFGEYVNYNDYKNHFEELQAQRKSQKFIQIAENEYSTNANLIGG
jgi:hypothetical protein